jgi:hypothetical protein
VGYGFTSLGGSGTDNDPAVSRAYLAAVSTGAAGTVTAWNPGSYGWPRRFGFKRLSSGDFMLGGAIQQIGATGADIDPAETRKALARVSSTAPATASAWRPDADGGFAAIYGITLDEAGGFAYTYGDHSTLGGTGADFSAVARKKVGKVSRSVPSSASAWRPDANAPVGSVLLSGTDVILFGNFTLVGGTGADINPAVTRNRVAMVSSAAPAVLNSWNPDANSAVIGGLLLGEGKLLVFGGFTTVANHVISGGVRCAVLELPS